MRGARSEQQEERPGSGRGPHEVDRSLGEPIRRVAAHEHRRALVDGVEVTVDRHPRLVLLRHEAVPAGRDEREPAERVAVQVLAHETRPVARVVQPRGEGGGGVEPVTVTVVEDAGVSGVQTRQQARPRGAAQRRVRERVRELGPSRARAGELGPEPRHPREGAGPLIVGQDDDHVRPVVGADGRGLRHGDRGHEGRKREERRAGRPTAGRPRPHSFRTFQMCSAGNARAHSSGA